MASVHAAGWDHEKLDGETRRCRRVLTLQAESGTSEERADLRRRLDEAREMLARRGPRIDDEIRALSKEKAALERPVREISIELDRREVAHRKLPEFAPAHIHAFVSLARKSIRGKYRDVPEMENRCRMIREISTLPASSEAAKLHCAGAGQKANVPTQIDDAGRVVLIESRWREYVGRLRSELPALETKLAERRAAYEAELAEAEKALGCYQR
ncbi:MAG: hypothetical protein AB7O38_02070 [Pirellulaceae bacterium]